MVINTPWVLCAFVESKATITQFDWLFCFTDLSCSTTSINIFFKCDLGLILLIFKILEASHMTSGFLISVHLQINYLKVQWRWSTYTGNLK